ncbi:MAG TPA: pantoate--beta-alanine ligase [Candidatus Avamphibacillus intestinigallinarum]|nr:pantoate--beta-alanine ligase [Candidatus Avamphibacillus intestinigallinarum]
MKVVRTPAEMQSIIKSHSTKSIGFVPTMGSLHEGHLSLVQKAKAQNDLVIVSIFVNPLQFGPTEDLEQYPRNEAVDCRLLEDLHIDYVFIPSAQAMYPTKPRIQLTLTDRVNVLCGQSRPGHFDGVAMVITKLVQIIKPTHMYFGLKDAQQFAVIQLLVEDLNLDVKLIGVETVRESDGLAKSSRNVYLTETEKHEAPYLYKGLQLGQSLIQRDETDTKVIIQAVKEYIRNHTSAEIDYVDILTYPSLEHIDFIEDDIILAGAIKFSSARLIDNVILTSEGHVKKMD